jgi:hypothetical protein
VGAVFSRDRQLFSIPRLTFRSLLPILPGMKQLVRGLLWLTGIALCAANSTVCAETEQIDLKALAKKARPAVMLLVISDANGKEIATGTGFLISADGKLITNFHVIEKASSIIAKAENGGLFPIEKIIGTDSENDLALLKIKGKDLPFLTLSMMDKTEAGTRIAVIGSPLGLEGTLSEGIVSAVRDLKDNRKVLQVTAAISRGSSGSPVLNAKGDVIGIAFCNFKNGQLLNFAVPVKRAIILDQYFELLGAACVPKAHSPSNISVNNKVPQHGNSDEVNELQQSPKPVLSLGKDATETITLSFLNAVLNFTAPLGYCLVKGKSSERAARIAALDSKNVTHFTLVPCAENGREAGFTGWAILKSPRKLLSGTPSRAQVVNQARKSIRRYDFTHMCADAAKLVEKRYEDVFGENVRFGGHMEMVDSNEDAGYMVGTTTQEIDGSQQIVAATCAMTVIRGNLIFYYKYAPYKSLADLARLLGEAKTEIHRFVVDNP